VHSSQSPFASVVFLTRNGGSLFQESLSAVFAQKTDFSFEVVVVDSGSTDGTVEFLREQPIRFHQIPPDSFNFGLTRDYGFSLGKGKVLITLSQDAVPATVDWLQTLCMPFNDPEVAVVQGREVPWPGRNGFFWERIPVFHLTRLSKRWSKMHQGFGLSFVNCAVRKSIWAANRMGRIEMSEDKVFQKSLGQGSHRIVFARDAKVWHSHQYDFRSLVKRCKNEGLGWKNVGMNYSCVDMLLDMFHPRIGLVWIFGLLTLQLKTPAEFLFPLIRPFSLYKGNHSTSKYIQ